MVMMMMMMMIDGDDDDDGDDNCVVMRFLCPMRTHSLLLIITSLWQTITTHKYSQENDSSTWQEKRGDEDFEEEDDNDNEDEDEGTKACGDQRQQSNEYIELLTVKEYLVRPRVLYKL